MLCWRAQPSLLAGGDVGCGGASVGGPAVSAAQALPDKQQLAAMLGDSFWGDRAQAVDGVVQQYLAAQMRRRRSEVPVVAAAPAIRPMWHARLATSAAVRPLCNCAIAATGGTSRAAWCAWW
jgi:hypothetical protein